MGAEEREHRGEHDDEQDARCRDDGGTIGRQIREDPPPLLALAFASVRGDFRCERTRGPEITGAERCLRPG